MMTRLTLSLFCLFFGFLISSCGDDGTSIAGSYSIFSFSIANCDDPNNNRSVEVGEDGCEIISGIEVCLMGVIILNDDNTFTISSMISSTIFSQDVNGSGEYTVSGDTITICDGEDCLDGQIDGDVLTISIPSDDGCIITAIARR